MTSKSQLLDFSLETDQVEACISCDTNGTTDVWSITSGQVYNTLLRNQAQQNRHSSTYLTQHQTFISAQENRASLSMFDIRRAQPMFTCAQQEKISVLCSTSGDNTGYVFGGSENGRVFIWNAHSGQLVKMFDAHLNAVTAICCTPEGNEAFLITAGRDTVIHVWNLATLLDVKTLSNRKMDPIFTFSSHSLSVTSLYSTKGSNPKLISTSMDRTCKVWDLLSGTEICSIVVPCSLLAATIDPTEHFIYMGGSNGRVYQVNIYPHVPSFVDEYRGAESSNTEFNVNQNSAFVSENTGMSGGTRNLTIEHASSLNTEISHHKNYCCVYSGHSNSVTDLALSRDGTKLVTASKDGKCLVWDTESKQILFAFKKHASGSDHSISSVSLITMSLSQFSVFHHDENVTNSAKADQKKKSEMMFRKLKPLKQLIGAQTLQDVDAEDANEDGCTIAQLNVIDDNWKQLTNHSVFDLGLGSVAPSTFTDYSLIPADSIDLSYRDLLKSSVHGISTNLTDRLHGAFVEQHYKSDEPEQAAKKRRTSVARSDSNGSTGNEAALLEEINKLQGQVSKLKEQNSKQKKINNDLYALCVQALHSEEVADSDEEDEEMEENNGNNNSAPQASDEESSEEEEEEEPQKPTKKQEVTVTKVQQKQSVTQPKSSPKQKVVPPKTKKNSRYF